MGRSMGALLVVLGGASVAAGQILFSLHAPYPPPPRFSADPRLIFSLPLFLGGAVVALTGLARVRLPTLESGEAPPDAGRTSRLHKAAFVVLLLVAFGVRAYRINEMPPPFFDDEANVAIDAMKYREGQFPRGSYTGWFETPLAFTAVNSLALATFGPTVLGSRVMGLVSGTLTVPAVYFVARAMMGPSIGLLAMTALALDRWHITIGRFAAPHITLPLLVAVAFAFTCRAFDLVIAARPTLALPLRRPRDRVPGGSSSFPSEGHAVRQSRWAPARALYAFAGGASLGAAMYTYLPSRLVALGVFFFLVYFALLSLVLRRRTGRDSGWAFWQRLMLCLIYGVSYLLVFAPLALHYLANPGMFTNRYKSINLLQQMGVGTGRIDWQPLITNLTSYPMMLNYAGNEVSRYGPPYQPVLNVIAATLFAFGVILLLRTFWRPASMFCLVWAGVPLLGGVLTWSETPSPLRTIVVSTAVAVIAVIPFHYVSLWLRDGGYWRREGVRLSFFAIAAGLLLASGLIDLRTYWGVQRSDGNLHRYCNYTEYAVAERVRAIDDRDPVYLRPHLYTFSSIKLLNWNRPNLRLFVPSEHIPLLEPEDVDVHIFLDLEASALTRAIALFHPRAEVLVQPVAETPGFGYTEVIIPAEDLAGSRGFWMASDGERKRVRALDGPANTPGGSVTWEAILDAPRQGAYRFRVDPAVDSGRVELTVGGRKIGGPEETVNLLAGRAELRVRGQGLAPGARLDIAWRRPDADWEPVPMNRVYAFPAGLSNGLRGSYYLGMTPSGVPFAERIDLIVAANESIQSPHSVRWTGFIDLPADGVYGFHAWADDGVRLRLDGEPWIDKWEVGGTAGDARGFLAAGRHAIEIEYFDQGGGRILELRWTPPGGGTGDIPFDLLRHE